MRGLYHAPLRGVKHIGITPNACGEKDADIDTCVSFVLPFKLTVSPPISSLKPYCTGATLAQALDLTDSVEQALDDAELDASDRTPEIDAHSDAIHFMLRLADGRYNPSVLTIEDSRRIEEVLSRLPLYASYAAFGNSGIYFATQGFRDKLWHRAEAERLQSKRDSDGHSEDVSFETYARIVDEAILYHVVYPDVDVRRCAYCSRWYEPEYRSRGRFCSAECRKRFAILGKTVGKNTFVCAIGQHEASLSEFSGLRVRDYTGQRTTLRISGFLRYAKTNTCVSCVQSRVPAWFNYVAPLVNSGPRAPAS